MQGVIQAPFRGQFPSGGGGSSGGSALSATLTNGEAVPLAVGDVCYLFGNNTVKKAKANGTEAQATALFIATGVIAAGADGVFATRGLVTGLAGGTVNTLAYLSATAGGISATPILTAGQYNVLLGIWQSATRLQFNPQLPILN